VEGTEPFDLGGNSVPYGSAPDIGAFEWIRDTFDILIVVKDETTNVVEGATVWMEENGSISTDANGEALFIDVLAGSMIPISIEHTGYPALSGSIDINSDDTATYTLSMNTYDLSFVVTDKSGTPLENAEVFLPGIDTLNSDENGKGIFTDVTESANMVYRVGLEGYHTVTGTIEHFKADSVEITLEQRSITLEFKDIGNLALKDVHVEMDEYGAGQTDALGIITFIPVKGNDTITYSAEKTGFLPFTDSVVIGNDNVYKLVRLEKTVVQLRVVDISLLPVQFAAVVINEEIKYADENGLVTFYGVPLNEYLAWSVYQTGYQTNIDSTLLTGSGELKIIVLQPPTRYSVNFHITDFAGGAIKDAMVTLSGYGIMLTDSSGNAVFDDILPAENIIFSVLRAGYRDTVNILHVTNEDVMVTIALAFTTGIGIDTEDDIGDIVLYPNPASGVVNINLLNNEGDLEVFDLHGRIIFSQKDQAEIVSLDASSWDAGLYYVRFNVDGSRSGTPHKLIILK